MKDFFKRKPVIILGVILLIFLFSLTWYLVDSSKRTVRVLFFPDNITMGVAGEVRKIPKQDSKEKNIEKLIKELFLGPQNINNGRLFPRNTRLISLIYRQHILYINFSGEMLLQDEEVRLSTLEILKIVEDTLFYNFPSLKEIHFSILGEPVVGRENGIGKV